MNEFDDFLNSLEARKYLPIMVHKPSDIEMAKRCYEGYLTKEELCERQYTGRFWDFGGGALYILLDNELVLRLNLFYNPYDVEAHITEEVDSRRDHKYFPDTLRGRYYND